MGFGGMVSTGFVRDEADSTTWLQSGAPLGLCGESHGIDRSFESAGGPLGDGVAALGAAGGREAGEVVAAGAAVAGWVAAAVEVPEEERGEEEGEKREPEGDANAVPTCGRSVKNWRSEPEVEKRLVEELP